MLAKLKAHAHRFPNVERMYTERGLDAVAGEWRGISFIVTQNADYVHCSLSVKHGRRVLPSQAKAFFRWWGVSPHGERMDFPNAAHWSVREGALQ